jgi:pimeloyl-ACP methyl ester carboxylesterase
MTKTISVAGTTLELVERGDGRPLLFLHAGEGLAPERPWLELLSRNYRVIAPWHPGYSNSPLIEGSGSVDDLAYLYLDLAAELELEGAALVGTCFGGWVAAEMMVRSTARFSHLVLVDPLGIKISDREGRDIADMHALPRAEYLRPLSASASVTGEAVPVGGPVWVDSRGSISVTRMAVVRRKQPFVSQARISRRVRHPNQKTRMDSVAASR